MLLWKPSWCLTSCIRQVYGQHLKEHAELTMKNLFVMYGVTSHVVSSCLVSNNLNSDLNAD